MIPRILTVLVLALFSLSLFGATPIATVSSTQAIVVSGITVPANRVISWPISLHDEIVTQTAPAMLRFTDGTVVTLQRNSRLKLEQGPSGVEVKMLSGSAIYDVKTRSTVSFGPDVKMARNASSAVISAPVRTAGTSSNEAAATALAYRMPATAPRSGMVVAPTAISTGSFIPASIRQEVTSVGTGTQITLPNGTILEVHPVTTGGQTSYVIDKVNIPVQVAGQTTPTYVTTPSSSSLVGASITVAAPSSGQQQQISVFAPGSSTPLTPEAVAQQVQQATTDAYQDSLTKGQIPASTPAPPPPSPISVGTLSGSAS